MSREEHTKTATNTAKEELVTLQSIIRYLGSLEQVPEITGAKEIIRSLIKGHQDEEDNSLYQIIDKDLWLKQEDFHNNRGVFTHWAKEDIELSMKQVEIEYVGPRTEIVFFGRDKIDTAIGGEVKGVLDYLGYNTVIKK